MKYAVRLVYVGASGEDDLPIIYGNKNKTTGCNLCQLFCEISLTLIINTVK
jgi:hypothetical protein